MAGTTSRVRCCSVTVRTAAPLHRSPPRGRLGVLRAAPRLWVRVTSAPPVCCVKLSNPLAVKSSAQLPTEKKHGGYDAAIGEALV